MVLQKREMARRSFISCVGLLLLALLSQFSVHAQAASPAKGRAESHSIEQVNGKFLSSEVLDRLDRGDIAEVIVAFDDSSLIAQGPGTTVQEDLASIEAPNFPYEERLLRKGKLRAAGKAAVQRHFALHEYSVVHDYEHLPYSVVRVGSRGALKRLLEVPAVIGVYRDRTDIEKFLSSSLPAAGMPIVPNPGWGGEGTTIAVLDDGVDLFNSAFGACGLSPGGSACKVVDASGVGGFIGNYNSRHGTNVAAIALGAAPGARVVSYNVWDSSGTSPQKILDGINWVIARKATYNIVSLNLSLGSVVGYANPCYGAELSLAFDILRSLGIVPVVASGNNGIASGIGFDDQISWPACLPNTVSVGAADDAGARAPFANIAYFLTLLAPGVNVTAAGIPYSGTSQAAPHVTGAFAVIKPKYPLDSVDMLVQKLTGTGRTTFVGPTSGGFFYGFSRLYLADFRTIYGDETPNPFAFASRQNVQRNQWVESDIVTLTGFQTAVPVSVSGGEYSVNGTAYRSSPSQVYPGQNVKVRVLSSSQYGTETSVLLNVGGQIGRFAVTTEVDAAPDPFSFATRYNAPRNQWIESEAVTLTGFQVPLSISVTGGEYSVNGSAYSSSPAQVVPGQSVTLRLLSSTQYGAESSVSLNVGGQVGSFSVVTEVDDRPAPFSFAARTGVKRNQWIESDLLTLTDFQVAASVSVNGGEYSIDGAAYSSVPSSMHPGQAVKVRVLSSGQYKTETSVSLTVGGETGTFTVATEMFPIVPIILDLLMD